MLDKLFQIERVHLRSEKRDAIIGPGYSTTAWIGERESKAMCTNGKLCTVLVHCSSIRFTFVDHWVGCRAVNVHIGDGGRLFRCINYAECKGSSWSANGWDQRSPVCLYLSR